jgi:1,4-alpha-glucan branching enzyme
VRAQIQIAVEAFERAFGRRPQGFWLPECGYYPGHDALLARAGLEYTFVETHALLFGSPRPKYGVYAPVQTPAGLRVFARDLAASKSVWSATEGYPKDATYREFHRDIGTELEHEYLKPFLGGDGVRAPTGLKYHRVTGATEDKDWYDPEAAMQTVLRHASDFVEQRAQQAQAIRAHMDRDPVIVACFDAELFGHWWYEGPEWLEAVAVAVADSEELELQSPSQALAAGPSLQVVTPTLSSWGVQGYSEMWLNGSNDWIYRRLHVMAERMQQLAQQYVQTTELQQRLLNQMARELLLAQASDWPFILKTQTHSTYAYQRLQNHTKRFTELDEMLQRRQIEEAVLASFEYQDNCFPWINYRTYASDLPTKNNPAAKLPAA